MDGSNNTKSQDSDQNFSSASKWRHQESSKYAKHAEQQRQARANEERGDVSDLAGYLNSTRIEGTGPPGAGAHGQANALEQPNVKPIIIDQDTIQHAQDLGPAQQQQQQQKARRRRSSSSLSSKKDSPQTISGAKVDSEKDAFKYKPDWEGEGKRAGQPTDGREVRCGPLLNYRRMEGDTWYGSVLIVLRGGRLDDEAQSFKPSLLLRKVGSRDPTPQLSRADTGQIAEHQLMGKDHGLAPTEVEGVLLYADLRTRFWRFTMQLKMEDEETQWAYEIPGLRFTTEGKRDKQRFWVPSVHESMRIMFHSCNGFSVGTDEEAYSGAALWNDVQRVHAETPFHVMLGGGDQIYNDGIRVHGPLHPWTKISNPRKRRNYPFPEKLRKECDDYYVSNYIRWYSTEPFAGANGQIAQLNLWDDHDIIDGFGSYVKDFMMCDVFRGIGGVAYKYYLLFQHHLPPPVSTYTTDAPQTMVNEGEGVGADPAQTKDTYVLTDEENHKSYIIGKKPGPYVAEHSRSIITRLGARIAFFGLDARTERTRHQVNYPETYQQIFDRITEELAHAAQEGRPLQHLVVLLGIPIAYPRLTWLENIFSSPLMAPIKFLNKRFGIAGGFINHFDGGVDLLDDLDDHYTARTHKKERHELIKMLQDIAATYSVRVTILSGDVHLAAVGRFYSNAKLGIPVDKDHRYMVNVVSSAIVNKPPPGAIASLLARRNKIHHLDVETDETLMSIFDKEAAKDGGERGWNKVTMPCRNWAMLTECSPNDPRTARGNAAEHNPQFGVQHNQQGQQNQQQGQGAPVAQSDGTWLSRPYEAENTAVDGKAASSLRPHTAATNTTNNSHTSGHSLPNGSAGDIGHGRDKKAGYSPLGPGEQDAGTKNRAADSRQHGLAGDGALDVAIRVEQDQHNSAGHTTSYGMYIPKLEMGKRETKMVRRDWEGVFRFHHVNGEKQREKEEKKVGEY